MYRKILLFLLAVVLTSGAFSQVSKCFRSPTTWNLSMSLETYLQERHTRMSQFPGFYSADIYGSIQHEKFTYSIGAGYGYDEEIVGFDRVKFTSFSLVNTITLDSTYWIDGQMYHYYEELKIYDSVQYVRPILINAEYRYAKIPIIIKYHAYSHWDMVDVFVKFKGNFFYEISRKIDDKYEKTENYNQLLETRKSKFYSLLGLGAEATIRLYQYNINSVIKDATVIKNISAFISFMLYYQPVKFQPQYKSTYISFAIGVRFFSW